MGERFDLLKDGLMDALEHTKGNLKLRTSSRFSIEPAKQYLAQDVKLLRQKLNVDQGLFAAYLNVSLETIKAWESGKQKPNSVANRLMDLLASEEKRNIFWKIISVLQSQSNNE